MIKRVLISAFILTNLVIIFGVGSTLAAEPKLEKDGLRIEQDMTKKRYREDYERGRAFNAKCIGVSSPTVIASMSRSWGNLYPGSSLACVNGKVSGLFFHPNGIECNFREGDVFKCSYQHGNGLFYETYYKMPVVRHIVSFGKNYVTYFVDISKEGELAFDIVDVNVAGLPSTIEMAEKLRRYYLDTQRDKGVSIVGIINTLMLKRSFRKKVLAYPLND